MKKTFLIYFLTTLFSSIITSLAFAFLSYTPLDERLPSHSYDEFMPILFLFLFIFVIVYIVFSLFSFFFLDKKNKNSIFSFLSYFSLGIVSGIVLHSLISYENIIILQLIAFGLYGSLLGVIYYLIRFLFVKIIK